MTACRGSGPARSVPFRPRCPCGARLGQKGFEDSRTTQCKTVCSGWPGHAIEGKRCLQEPSHALGDALLGDRDAVIVIARLRVHHRQLRPREVGDAVQYAAEHLNLSAQAL